MEQIPQETSKKSSFKDLDTHLSNPFAEELLSSPGINPRKLNHKELKPFTNEETGETIDFPTHNGDNSYFWKDSSVFGKVFLSESNCEVIANLSKSANYLFWLIFKTLKPNSDMVKVTVEDYNKFSKTNSKGAYYNAVVELVDKNFIAKISNTVYFINYTKFINGSRIPILDSIQDAEQAYYQIHRRKI